MTEHRLTITMMERQTSIPSICGEGEPGHINALHHKDSAGNG